MAASVMVRTRVPKSRKQKADRIFKKIGVTYDDAVNEFLAKVVEEGALPYGGETEMVKTAARSRRTKLKPLVREVELSNTFGESL